MNSKSTFYLWGGLFLLVALGIVSQWRERAEADLGAIEPEHTEPWLDEMNGPGLEAKSRRIILSTNYRCDSVRGTSLESEARIRVDCGPDGVYFVQEPTRGKYRVIKK